MHDKRGSWCGFSGLARICLIGGHASAMCSEENSAEDATQDTKLAIRLRCDGPFSRHFWHRAVGRGISQAFYFRAWHGTRLCVERCMVQCVLGTLFTSPTRYEASKPTAEVENSNSSTAIFSTMSLGGSRDSLSHESHTGSSGSPARFHPLQSGSSKKAALPRLFTSISTTVIRTPHRTLFDLCMCIIRVS
jgi:hypothetical protein